MFVGEHAHSLDSKGRVIFPSRMREDLGGTVVLQKGIERCVHVFPPDEWERRVAEVTSLRQTDADARAYARFFFSQATRERIDGQGRLTVPQAFRDYAGLERDVVVVGAGNRVELWDRGSWERQIADLQERLPEFTRQLDI